MRSTRILAALAEPESEVGQALAVLEAAGLDDAASLPSSRGDRELVALARRLSGRELELVVPCPRCELLNEVALAPGSLPPPAPRVAALDGGGVREPAYGDLLGLPRGEEEAVEELLRRCTVGAPRRRPTVAALELVDDALSGPIEFACAECGEPASIDADVQQVALARLVELARELEREVHLLASTYGWSLAEIEALPDGRRRELAALVRDGR